MRKILLLSLYVMASISVYAQSKHDLTTIKRSNADGNITDYFDPSLRPFYHGVASGDPLQNKVIIWTRVTPDKDGSVNVSWRMATDPNMTNVVNSGIVTTNISKDYTVKVDVDGLQPATTYYYDFTALGGNSIVGRTRTAPQGSINQLRFAVVSCSNYQDGYFNVYERISERNDIDALIHLGDYIYEYESGGYGHSDDVGRGHLPENEIVTLMDYRIRYSYYRLDPQLRKAHQQIPFITIWDDHEFANNAWMEGAENHQSNEGDWNTRKNNAYQAYFEWMPIRNPLSDPNRIYRKINYGNLMDLILLDTRVEGREEQKDSLTGKRKADLKSKTDYQAYVETIMPTAVKENLTKKEYEFLINTITEWAVNEVSVSKLSDLETKEEFKKARALVEKSYQAAKEEANDNKKMAADRQLLSETQFSWLENNLKNSQSKWRVVANQVLLMPLKGLGLTDTWDGYEGSRERFLNFIKDKNVDNVVMLTGDIHMTFAGDLPTSFWKYTWNKSNSAAVEFVAPSITSGNLDELVGISDGFLTWLLGLFNPHIKNADLNSHGYFILTVNDQKAQADWYYVDDVKRITSGQRNGESWYVKNGETRLREAGSPVISGSVYSVSAPERPLNTPGMLNNSVLVIGNYPNPAVNHTTIHYALSQKSKVDIVIRDMQGNVIKEVLHQEQDANIYALTVPTHDLKSGIYVYTVNTGSQKVVRRLVVK